MKKIIEEVFGDKYFIESLKNDKLILTPFEGSIPSAIYIGWTNSLQFIKFDSVVGLIRFDEVENILSPVLKKLKINNTSFGDWQSTLNWFSRLYGSEIEESDVKSLRKELIKIKLKVQEIEDEFFKKLTSLENTSNYLNSLNEEELSEKVNNPAFIRKFIIDSLSNNVESHQLLSVSDKIISEYVEAEKRYPHIFKNYDKAIKEVYKKLN